jgi:hypothetical protein
MVLTWWNSQIALGLGACFESKSRQAIGIARQFRGKDFERYLTLQLSVGGAIHFTPSARADCGGDPVMCNCAPDQIKLP